MPCKNCNNQFSIFKEDQAFYTKIGVPEPTLCHLCRQQRRLAFRNERIFYQIKSDLSNKDILSIYNSDKTFPVYDQDEWWSDDWDPLDYGQDIDWDRSILEQIQELFLKVPRPSLFSRNCVNSYYGNYQEGNHNCYYEVGSGWCEEDYYGTVNLRCKNVLDSHYSDKCELSYGLINCKNCFQSVNCQDCKDCLESFFCYNCRGCNNCFGCVNLRNAKFHWFNESISEEEFKKRIANLGKYSYYQEMKKKFIEFKKKNIHVYAVQIKCERSTGDYLTYCQDIDNGFDLVEASNCKYCYRGQKITDSYDCDVGGWPASWIYECLSADTTSYQMFSIFCWENSFIEYCHLCFTSHELFGCSGLRGQKYCILNKQYSEDEYRELKKKIIAKMKEDGEYGEFFPVQYSPFAYNESTAYEYYPLTKE